RIPGVDARRSAECGKGGPELGGEVGFLQSRPGALPGTGSSNAFSAGDAGRRTNIKDSVFEMTTFVYQPGLANTPISRLIPPVPKSPRFSVALFVQTLLKMDRTDLARTEVTNMKAWSEDAPIAQLIEAWVGLKAGGDSYQQAFYIYEELGQSSAAQTAKMLNGKAVANFCLGKNSEAESELLEALNKVRGTLANPTGVLTVATIPPARGTVPRRQDPNDPETLVNLIACSIHLAKPADVIKRYMK
ncbi:MAG: coatomer epsilon subunit-domain-containing protein, partial [Olpidium bornovanus]